MSRADVLAVVRAALEAAAQLPRMKKDDAAAIRALDPAAIAAGVPVWEQNYDEVICPQCCHQFPAIPVNVQKELAAFRTRVAELENRIRDLCMGHPDTCQCRHCKAVFVQEHSGESAT